MHFNLPEFWKLAMHLLNSESMPSGHLKMQFFLKEKLAGISSSDMLISAMQSISPKSKAPRGFLRSPRGIDAASSLLESRPLSIAFRASIDGKMQLQARSLSPYITPPRGVRTQTQHGKAVLPDEIGLIANRVISETITATDRAENETCNRAIKPLAKVDSKRMCFVGDTFATDDADRIGACGKTTVCRRSEFTQKRTQAARDGRRLPMCDSRCASSDVAITFANRSPFSAVGFPTASCIVVGRQPLSSLAPEVVRFAGVTESVRRELKLFVPIGNLVYDVQRPSIIT